MKITGLQRIIGKGLSIDIGSGSEKWWVVGAEEKPLYYTFTFNSSLRGEVQFFLIRTPLPSEFPLLRYSLGNSRSGSSETVVGGEEFSSTDGFFLMITNELKRMFW